MSAGTKTSPDLAQIRKLEAEHLVGTYDRMPALVVRGKGAYIYDSAGRKYLDLLSGIGVNALGYAHPAIIKTIAAQSKLLVHTSNLFFHSFQGELARKLTQVSGLESVFFSNSGTEAWEGALKFARAYAQTKVRNGARPRFRVLAMSNSFHGRTFGSMATTGQLKYRKPFMPVMPGVKFVRFNDVADLRAKFDETVCAIALEPVQGEGGVQPVTREFLQAARELTARSGTLLVLDEIQCGLGRTGKYFAFQHYGIQPDIVTIAKPLAAGLPLGAVLTTKAVAAAIQPGMHGTTFGGGPLICAVALEFLATLEQEKLVQNAAKTGAYFQKRLIQITKTNPHAIGARGMGLMLALELGSAELAKHAVAQMLAEGVVINRTHGNVLRFLPPYTITTKQVDLALDKLERILRSA